MGWGEARRPRVSNSLGSPRRNEGGDGDIQIRQTNMGAKLFAKLGGSWHTSSLTSTTGDQVTRFGTNPSDYLSIDSDSVDVYKNSVKVAEFGSDIKFHGKIIIGNPNGTFSANDNIYIGNGQSGIGLQNVAIGYQAGEDLAALSSSNVLIGYNAGKEVGSGINNTCVGSTAGNTIVGGSYNTCIGNASDAAASSSRQVAIGDTAVTNAPNCIAIGSDITNSTTDTVMFGDNADSISSADWSSSGAIAWTATSDVRKKRNIKDNSLGLEFINKLKTRIFQWRPQNEVPKEWQHYSETNEWDLDQIHIGFIAQEVKALLDEYDAPTSIAGWSQDADGMQRLGETKLITPLIKAVQELSAKIDTMQTEINNLK